METTIKTTVYAARLRARAKELRGRRTGELRAYERGVAAWRTALAKWVGTVGVERALKAMPPERYRFSGDMRHFDMTGAPTPPKKPDDKIIRKISALLRQLGIAGQTTIRVTTENIAELFEDEGSDDE